MPKTPPNGSGKNGKASKPGDEFEQFKALTKRLVSVPKREIDKLRDADKNGNGR